MASVKFDSKTRVKPKKKCTFAAEKKEEDEVDFVQVPRRRQRSKPPTKVKNDGKRRSMSDLLEAALQNVEDKVELEELGRKPDLWMVAFDNPLDFIQYCRKRMDHERDLLEKSRIVENEVVNLIRRWSEDTRKYTGVLDDLCKVQNHNDKLKEIVMEERTNCQHLVGENYQLESEKKLLARKYQAALMLGKVDDKSVKHLLERNPKAVPLTDKLSDLENKIKMCDNKYKGAGDCADPYILAEKVDRLEAQLHKMKRQHHEEVTVLKDSISKYDMKYDSIKMLYKDALKRNTDAFEDVRDVLALSIHENLQLREEILKKDDRYLLAQEEGVDKMKSRQNHVRSAVRAEEDEFDEAFDPNVGLDEKGERSLKTKVSRMEIELEEKSSMVQDVLHKLMMLERSCSRLKEENAAMKKSHQHSLNALRERNQVLQKRCERTDERRKLDNSGFREDVRELKFLLKTLDKNVVKCIRLYGDIEAESAEADQPRIDDGEFEDIVNAQRSGGRYKAWLQKTDPKLVQRAMVSWTDFLAGKLSGLEDMIINLQPEAK